MGKAILNSILLLFVTVPLAAQSKDWKPYSNTAGNFKVLFPGDPTDSLNNNSGESHTLMFVQAPYVYAVVYGHSSAAQRVDEATYEEFKAQVLKVANCKADAGQPAAPAIDGYIGHLYRLNCGENVTGMGNLYWGKHYGYAVVVMYVATASSPADQNKFLDSFELIDPGK